MTAVPAGITGLDRIAQVKLPVTDLARSVSWYRRLLDLRLWTEFVEDGVLRGAGPRLDVPDPDGTVVRFYYYTGPTGGFTGLEMRDGQVVGTYHTPQLQ